MRAYGKNLTICHYCNRPVRTKDRRWKYQNVHTSCVLEQPFDLTIRAGTFYAELHSELIAPKRLSKLIASAVKAGEKKGED